MVSMTSPTHLSLAVGIALLAGVSCRDDNNVTGPTSPANLEELAAVTAGNTWARKAPLSPARWSAGAGSINGIIYVAGGWGRDAPLSRVDAYKISTNTWSRVASLPAARGDVNGASVINNKLYVSGGTNRTGRQTRTLFVYDPATNQWTQKADMPRASCGGDQGVIGGQLYVYTGCYSKDNNGEVFFRYNPSTNTWVKRAPPPVDHNSGGGAAVNGKFYLNGGYTPECGGSCIGNTHNLDVYDPATNTWTVRAGTGTTGLTGAALNSKLYAIGGEGDTYHRTVQAYDPGTNTWNTRAPLPEGSALGTATMANGKLYYLEGRSPTIPWTTQPSRFYAYTP
jgi:N-acetylneuraminic acid mutarotase